MFGHFFWLVCSFFFVPLSLADAPVVLHGAGSSLAAQLYSAAALAYSFVQPNVSIQFADLGSERGLCRLKSASRACAPTDTAFPLAIDFAGIDIPLTAQDYSEYPDLQMYPTVASAVVPIFNLGSTTNLVLSTFVLAQIFLGAIQYWDDPEILRLNPDFNSWRLPRRQPIELVVCRDRCGATDIFKKALASFHPAFRDSMISSTSTIWFNVTPTTQIGDQGIVSYIMTTPFTLGYAALGTAAFNSVPMAKIMKSNGYIITASVASIEHALLQMGTDFGNNGDDPSHLTADIYNAQGLWSWPITSYTYLLMHKWTLRSGATCENVKQTMAFWYWFWTSDVVAGMVQEYNFSNLPSVVRKLVANRFMQDIRCNLKQVWQPEEVKPVTAVGPTAVNVLFLAMAKIYGLVNTRYPVQFIADDASVGELDPNERLKVSTVVATTGRLQQPVVDGATLIFAGLAIVAITQVSLILDGLTLAKILDGVITTWLSPEIMALNPNGILDHYRQPITNTNETIVLLQGPTATSIPLDRMMKAYWPQYTGAAIRSAPAFANEDILRSVLLGHSFGLSVTPYIDLFPAGLKTVHLRRGDGVVVGPTSESIQACASPETYDPATSTIQLQFSKANNCYPLSETMFLSVKKSMCDMKADPLRTTAIDFIEWLFLDHALDNVIRAASMAPLQGVNQRITAHNTAAIEYLTCKPKAQGVLPVIIGTSVGVSGLFMVVMGGLLGFRRHGRRDTSAAPKDPNRPFCVIFTDIQSSTQLWATIPGEMATAMNFHHALIRRLIKHHKLYEVKSIGDSFMCACVDPLQALSFALDVQRQFFDFDWGTAAIDAVYNRDEKEEGKGINGSSARRRTCPDLFSGLRVRVGIHFGLGQIKLDPVTQCYDYFGTVVNIAARIESLCHGGQTAVSQELFDQLGGVLPGGIWLDLGTHSLRGLLDPIHLYQVLPSGPLARRKFPPLRLERVSDHAEEAMDYEAIENRSHPTGSSSRSSQALPVFQPEHHPLVLNGNITVEELRKNYNTIMMTLNTLLATQTSKFKETVLQGLCGRLRVRHPGSNGAQLQQTLHQLVLRILPAIVFHRDMGTGEEMSTPVVPFVGAPSPTVSPLQPCLPPFEAQMANVFGQVEEPEP